MAGRGFTLAGMDPFNVFDAVVPPGSSESRPEGFRRGHVSIGEQVGGSGIGATLYELPPGQRICPYHYEYNNEEWLVVLEGRPTLRTPSGERELKPGDVVAFLEGPEGAHDAANRTDDRVRIVMLSTKRKPAVAVYPDSDKMAIWRLDGPEADEIIVKRSSNVGYWEDEPV
jgi:uncharacterized cupin superfamily protein